MAKSEFERRSPYRKVMSKVIVACEGAETERLYFTAIRAHLHASRKDIVIVEHQGTDPLTIVKSAVDAVERERVWAKGDTGWAVFDGDEHREKLEQRTNWERAMALAERHSIRVVVSNPCFELWYLLHFQDQNSSIHRVAANHALKTHLPTYDKSTCIFEKLHTEGPHPLTANAIRRAKVLHENNLHNQVPLWTNPSTRVFELVERLLGPYPATNNRRR